MATIAIEHPHRTDLADAAQRTRDLMDAFRAEKPNLIKAITWSDDSLHGKVKGKGFKGDFRIDDTHVVVAIELSWIALPLKGRVRDSLNKRLVAEFGA